MTALFELEPDWVTFDREGNPKVCDEADRAQGVAFECPKCGRGKGSAYVIAVFRNTGGPGRSEDQHSARGGLPDLTLSPMLKHGCGWSGFVTNGHVT